MANAPLRVAIAGLGPIGKKVAEALDQGIDGLSLAAVSAQNPEKHHNWLGTLKALPAVLPIEKLSEVADLAIECAPAKLLRSIVAPFVQKGKTAIVLSAGALLDNEDLIDIARQNGGQIVVPTGALIGLDAVTAAAAARAAAAGRWPALAVSGWELAAVVTAGSLLSPSVAFRLVHGDVLPSALG